MCRSTSSPNSSPSSTGSESTFLCSPLTYHLTFHGTLRASWRFLTAHRRDVAITIGVFATLLAVNQWILDVRVEREMQTIIATIGVDPRELQSLMFKAGFQALTGNQEAASASIVRMQEIYETLQRITGAGSPDELAAYVDAMQRDLAMRLLPFRLAYGFIAVIIGTLGGLTLFVLALEGGRFGSALARAMHLLIPVTGLWIWIWLRAFGWLSIVLLALLPLTAWVLVPLVLSVMVVIALAPRYAAAQVLLARGTGIRASARTSWEQTRGHYGRIVGYMLLASLLTWITVGLLGIPLAVLASVALPIASAWITNALTLAATAGITAFSVALILGILHSPPSPSPSHS